LINSRRPRKSISRKASDDTRQNRLGNAFRRQRKKKTRKKTEIYEQDSSAVCRRVFFSIANCGPDIEVIAAKTENIECLFIERLEFVCRSASGYLLAASYTSQL